MHKQFTKENLIEDIEFLASRIHLMGKFTCDEPRSWGASSNSLLEIAYGERKPEDVIMPSDESDWRACQNLIVLIPLHRKIDIKGIYKAYHQQEAEMKAKKI